MNVCKINKVCHSKDTAFPFLPADSVRKIFCQYFFKSLDCSWPGIPAAVASVLNRSNPSFSIQGFLWNTVTRNITLCMHMSWCIAHLTLQSVHCTVDCKTFALCFSYYYGKCEKQYSPHSMQDDQHSSRNDQIVRADAPPPLKNHYPWHCDSLSTVQYPKCISRYWN